MAEYDLHDPDYSGATESEWDAPKLEDFGSDDLAEIDDHLLLAESGFPPETFGDLALPVVEPGGDLNLNALETAHGGAHGVGAVEGIDGDTAESVRDALEELAASEFDHEIDG